MSEPSDATATATVIPGSGMHDGHGSSRVDSRSVTARLVAARDEHPTGTYDEVFHEVAGRVSETGSISKADIGTLLFWKRLRADTSWAAKLHNVPDIEVRAATARMLQAARDPQVSTPDAASAARRALHPLPGFAGGDALASAVIAAAQPKRMAVYDRRAHAALKNLMGVDVGRKPGRYRRYMAVVGELLETVHEERPGWTARDVDLALYWIGGEA